MWPYWALFAFFSIAAFLTAREQTDRQPRLFLLLSFLIIALFVGLRYDVGADWDGYLFIYQRITAQSLGLRGDIAFYSVMAMSREAGLEIWVPNLIFAAIFAAGLVAFAVRQPNMALVITIALPYLVIAVAMSGVRQATALGILLFAFNAFARERQVLFVLLVFAASLFHASALIMLGVALIANARGKMWAVIITAALLPLAYSLLSTNVDTFLERYDDDRLQSGGALVRLLMNFVPAVIFLLNARAFGFTAPTTALWRVLSWAAIICVPLYAVLPSSTALDRLAIYLIPLQLVVFANLPFLKLAWLPSRMLSMLLIVLLYAFVMATFFNFGVTSAEWLPYRTWLD